MKDEYRCMVGYKGHKKKSMVGSSERRFIEIDSPLGTASRGVRCKTYGLGLSRMWYLGAERLRNHTACVGLYSSASNRFQCMSAWELDWWASKGLSSLLLESCSADVASVLPPRVACLFPSRDSLWRPFQQAICICMYYHRISELNQFSLVGTPE
jgi:hypothetical protein